MIKKFKIFESHSEIDPYDEEIWGDDEGLKEGDIVVCIRGGMHSSTPKTGKKYIVVSVESNFFTVKIKTLEGEDMGDWFQNRFVKINNINESIFSEIDPLGEEDWEELPYSVIILPNFADFIQPNGYWHRIHANFIGKIFNVKNEQTFKDIKCYNVIDFENNESFLVPKECTEKID